MSFGDVEDLSNKMGNLQCSEDKTISDIKVNVGYTGPSHTIDSHETGCKNKGPLDEDDPVMDPKFQKPDPKFQNPQFWFDAVVGQVKSLQTAVSVPLLQVVKVFEGDPAKFKQWVKDIERYAQMSRLGDADIPRIAHITCSGSVADYVQRYLDECVDQKRTPSWKKIKDHMTKRFAEITDPQQAMAVLRKVRQKSDESVQMYSERLLRVAEDAYPPNTQETDEARKLVQKQLVDIFCDGLFHDYLRMKVLRADPSTFSEAVDIAMKEQNLRKRFNLRSHDNYDMLPATYTESETRNLQTNSNFPFINANGNAPSVPRTEWPSWVSQIPGTAPDSRQIEPMEIDHYRSQKCFNCFGLGHRARECPTRRRNYVSEAWPDDRQSDDEPPDDRQVPKTAKVRKPPVKRDHNGKQKQTQNRNAGQNRNRQKQVPPQVPDWIRGAECWICHMIGHLKRNCPNRHVPDRNRVPVYPQGNGNPQGPRIQEN